VAHIICLACIPLSFPWVVEASKDHLLSLQQPQEHVAIKPHISTSTSKSISYDFLYKLIISIIKQSDYITAFAPLPAFGNILLNVLIILIFNNNWIWKYQNDLKKLIIY